MNLFLRTVFILGAAAVGLALGFLWKSALSSAVPPAPSANTATQPTRLPSTAPAPTQSEPAPPAAAEDIPYPEQLERDLSMSEGVTRWLYWLEAIERAKLADFPQLAHIAAKNPVALRFVAARWIELDPRHLFDTLATASQAGELPLGELADMLFSEWPKKDPEAAIAALNDKETLGPLVNWRHHVANTVFRSDVERGLQLMSEWHIENHGPSTSPIKKWAAANPRHAAEFTLGTTAGYATERTMQTIGGEWAKTDPVAALDFAEANTGRLGTVLADAVMEAWAEQDLQGAAEWTLTTAHPSRGHLTEKLVEIMAKQDVDTALSWSVQNLSGTSLNLAIAGVFKGAADTDVQQAAALVIELDVSPARTEAARVVAEKWFPRGPHESRPVSQEAVAWLSSLDDASARRILEQIGWGWASTDPLSMADYLAHSPSAGVPNYTDGILARQLARRDPAAALNWAEELPQDRGLSVGGTAFTEWRAFQPEAAMQWLNDLPPTDPRRKAYFKSVIQSIVYDPQAARQLAAMAPSEQRAAREIIESLPSIANDRRTTLLGALRQP